MDSCKIEILALFFLVKYVFEYKVEGVKKISVLKRNVAV